MLYSPHKLIAWALLLIATGLNPLEGYAADDPHRAIMANDRLRISISEAPSLDGIYPVAGDGTMDIPAVGRVLVEGLSLEDAAREIATLLEARHFRRATVSLEISEYVEGALMVLGAVRNPGLVPIRGDQLITLMEAITIVGGLSDRAASDQVRILRWKPGGRMERETILVNMKEMFDRLDFSRDQYLRPRDIIYVPRRSGQDGSDEFLALGEVGNPGFHPYSEGMNIVRAVVAAGGLSREARMDAARILRPSRDGDYDLLTIDLGRIFGEADMRANIPVFPGDILFVPSSGAVLGGRVYFMGQVERPGALTLPSSGEATLARTIFTQVGFTRFANRGNVKLIRRGPDGSRQELTFDVGRILDSGDFSGDIPLQDEDVIMVSERLFGF
ncbi:MAG TPA: SLBB domain-containing protein [Kiritimatiellia bacterium]|nr:SLBB domain-containing protein [Kiritimatiellia bacterium]